MTRSQVPYLAVGAVLALGLLARAEEARDAVAPMQRILVLPRAVSDAAGERLPEPRLLSAETLMAWEGEPVSMLGVLRLGRRLPIGKLETESGHLHVDAIPAYPLRSSYVVFRAESGGDSAWAAIEVPTGYDGSTIVVEIAFNWGSVPLRGRVDLPRGMSSTGVSVVASPDGAGLAGTETVLLTDMGRLPAKTSPRSRAVLAPVWAPVAEDGSYALRLHKGWDYDLAVQAPGRRRILSIVHPEAAAEQVIRLPEEALQRVELWCGPDPTNNALPLFESAGASGYAVPFVRDGPVGGQWMASLRLSTQDDPTVTLGYRHQGVHSLQVLQIRRGADSMYWCSLVNGAAALTELE